MLTSGLWFLRTVVGGLHSFPAYPPPPAFSFHLLPVPKSSPSPLPFLLHPPPLHTSNVPVYCSTPHPQKRGMEPLPSRRLSHGWVSWSPGPRAGGGGGGGGGGGPRPRQGPLPAWRMGRRGMGAISGLCLVHSFSSKKNPGGGGVIPLLLEFGTLPDKRSSQGTLRREELTGTREGDRDQRSFLARDWGKGGGDGNE